jgi:hypothetical protein
VHFTGYYAIIKDIYNIIRGSNSTTGFYKNQEYWQNLYMNAPWGRKDMNVPIIITITHITPT